MRHNSKWILINFGILNGWRKAVEEDDPDGEVIEDDGYFNPFAIQKRFLRLLNGLLEVAVMSQSLIVTEPVEPVKMIDLDADVDITAGEVDEEVDESIQDVRIPLGIVPEAIPEEIKSGTKTYLFSSPKPVPSVPVVKLPEENIVAPIVNEPVPVVSTPVRKSYKEFKKDKLDETALKELENNNLLINKIEEDDFEVDEDDDDDYVSYDYGTASGFSDNRPLEKESMQDIKRILKRDISAKKEKALDDELDILEEINTEIDINEEESEAEFKKHL